MRWRSDLTINETINKGQSLLTKQPKILQDKGIKGNTFTFCTLIKFPVFIPLPHLSRRTTFSGSHTNVSTSTWINNSNIRHRTSPIHNKPISLPIHK
jgi:hypothetical protein